MFSWRFGKSAKKKREAQKDVEREARQAEREHRVEEFNAQRQGRGQMIQDRTEDLIRQASSLNDRSGSDEPGVRPHSRARSRGRDQRKAPGMDEAEEQMQEEIEGNLSFMGKHLQHLKAMGITMNQEIEGQTQMMEQMRLNADDAATKIAHVDARLKRRH